MIPLANKLSAIKRWLTVLSCAISGNERCAACGFRGRFLINHVMWPQLITTWELSESWAHWFDLREGKACPRCGSNLRSVQLAEAIQLAIKERIGVEASSLKVLFDDRKVQTLQIAEINSAGTLHPFLVKTAHLCYSEFGSKVPEVPDENLMKLSYPDSKFDLVITSETLEHVPDVDVALKEIYRVLKPGGFHVFTVPVVWDRPQTRQRATIRGGKVEHLFPPSYHGCSGNEKGDYLVFSEFGADFAERCERSGVSLTVLRDGENPSLSAFIAKKPA